MKEAENETLIQIASHRVIFAPVENAMVVADRDKIAQVLTNLINNAVKYSPLNSTVYVACVNRKGMAHISVQDEGMGISQQDLPKVFVRYYRVNNDSNQTISGFGIGLYLCAEIIKRHEGNIWAESELQKGSTFHFTLPVSD